MVGFYHDFLNADGKGMLKYIQIQTEIAKCHCINSLIYGENQTLPLAWGFFQLKA